MVPLHVEAEFIPNLTVVVPFPQLKPVQDAPGAVDGLRIRLRRSPACRPHRRWRKGPTCFPGSALAGRLRHRAPPEETTRSHLELLPERRRNTGSLFFFVAVAAFGFSPGG